MILTNTPYSFLPGDSPFLGRSISPIFSLWHVSGQVVSLSIIGDLVYATITSNSEVSGAGQSYIAAYKATTGERVWKSPMFPGDALSRFAVDQNIVYFGTLDTHSNNQPFTGRIYAYSIQNNRQLWSTPVDGGAQASLVVNNGLSGQEHQIPEMEGGICQIRAIDPLLSRPFARGSSPLLNEGEGTFSGLTASL